MNSICTGSLKADRRLLTDQFSGEATPVTKLNIEIFLCVERERGDGV